MTHHNYTTIPSRTSLPDLHREVLRGNEQGVTSLLEANYDISQVDRLGRTPLHYAAANGFYSIIICICNERPEVNLEPKDEQQKTPLFKAIEAQSVESVRVLIHVGSQVRIHDAKGRTPLHYGTLQRNLEIVSILYIKGADLDAQDDMGSTALHIAATLGHFEIASFLVKHGAKLNLQDVSGRTPLMCSAGSGVPKLMELLLKTGSSLIIKDKKGRGAADYLFQAGKLAYDVLEKFIMSDDFPEDMYKEDETNKMENTESRGNELCSSQVDDASCETKIRKDKNISNATNQGTYNSLSKFEKYCSERKVRLGDNKKCATKADHISKKNRGNAQLEKIFKNPCAAKSLKENDSIISNASTEDTSSKIENVVEANESNEEENMALNISLSQAKDSIEPNAGKQCKSITSENILKDATQMTTVFTKIVPMQESERLASTSEKLSNKDSCATQAQQEPMKETLQSLHTTVHGNIMECHIGKDVKIRDTIQRFAIGEMVKNEKSEDRNFADTSKAVTLPTVNKKFFTFASTGHLTLPLDQDGKQTVGKSLTPRAVKSKEIENNMTRLVKLCSSKNGKNTLDASKVLTNGPTTVTTGHRPRNKLVTKDIVSSNAYSLIPKAVKTKETVKYIMRPVKSYSSPNSQNLPSTSIKVAKGMSKVHTKQMHNSKLVIKEDSNIVTKTEVSSKFVLDNENIVSDKKGIVLAKERLVSLKDVILLEKESIASENDDIAVAKKGIIPVTDVIPMKNENSVSKKQDIVVAQEGSVPEVFLSKDDTTFLGKEDIISAKEGIVLQTREISSSKQSTGLESQDIGLTTENTDLPEKSIAAENEAVVQESRNILLANDAIVHVKKQIALKSVKNPEEQKTIVPNEGQIVSVKNGSFLENQRFLVKTFSEKVDTVLGSFVSRRDGTVSPKGSKISANINNDENANIAVEYRHSVSKEANVAPPKAIMTPVKKRFTPENENILLGKENVVSVGRRCFSLDNNTPVENETICLENANSFARKEDVAPKKEDIVPEKEGVVLQSDTIVQGKENGYKGKGYAGEIKNDIISARDDYFPSKEKLSSDAMITVGEIEKTVSAKDEIVPAKENIVTDKNKILEAGINCNGSNMWCSIPPAPPLPSTHTTCHPEAPDHRLQFPASYVPRDGSSEYIMAIWTRVENEHDGRGAEDFVFSAKGGIGKKEKCLIQGLRNCGDRINANKRDKVRSLSSPSLPPSPLSSCQQPFQPPPLPPDPTPLTPLPTPPQTQASPSLVTATPVSTSLCIPTPPPPPALKYTMPLSIIVMAEMLKEAKSKGVMNQCKNVHDVLLNAPSVNDHIKSLKKCEEVSESPPRVPRRKEGRRPCFCY